MAQNTKKKKNRKLMRQIRKTVGALFMASAIAVAAIPVQDIEAKDVTNKIQVLNYTDATMKHWESLDNDSYADTTDLKKIQSAFQSKVPYVADDATIYTTGDGMYQFAFVKPSSTDLNEVAVILGANITDLPENGLVIPETVDAYRKYTGNTTNTGYCAVSRSDEYLYYKKTVHKTDPQNQPLYTVPGLAGKVDDPGEITTYNTNVEATVQNEDGSWNYVYKYDTGQTDIEGKPIIQKLPMLPVITDSCVPCYYDAYPEWAKFTDQQLYYWDGQGDVDPNAVDQFKPTLSIDQQRIHDADVQYIGRQYIVPDDANPGSWKIGGIVDETDPSKGVFAGMGQIVNLTIGSNLVGIGDYAFYGCSGLASVKLGNGLNTIGNGAFEECVNLLQCNMQLNSQISAIGKRAFANCRGLTNLTIPVNVRAIGDECFAGCSSLEEIDLCGAGSNVLLQVIGCDAFKGCSSLTSITFPDNYRDYETVNGETGIPITYFEGCTSLQYIKVQNGAFTFIEENHGTQPCDINTFLKSVPEIFYFEGPADSPMHQTARKHSAAFKYLGEDKYEKVVWCPETEYDDTTGEIIQGTGHEATFMVDSSNRLIDMIIDDACGIVEIPANIGAYGIETIGSTGFQNNCILEKVIIPSTVRFIEDRAFRGCHHLKHVVFSKPVNIESIGADAFDTQQVDLHKQNCPNKTLEPKPELSFTGEISPDSLPFQYAMDPGNNINAGGQPVTHITFYSGWPTNLTVKYNKDTEKNELLDYPRYEELKNYVEWDKNTPPSQGKITYPDLTEDHVKAAQEAVAKYEAYLTGGPAPTEDEMNIINSALNINLPMGIEAIQTGLFSGMKEDPDDPKNMVPAEDRDGNVIQPNEKVESVTMHTVEEIEPYAFAGCDELRGFYMADGKSVGNYAFKGNPNLENVSIGPTIEELGIRPFAACPKLQHVSFDGSPFFTCESCIIYELEEGKKDSIIECLEVRGSVGVGSITVGPDELAGVTNMREEAFMDCVNVGKVDLSMTEIDVVPERAFQNMSKMNTVVLPSTVKNIEDAAFRDCKDLMLVTIPGQQAYIAKDAFATSEYLATGDQSKQNQIVFECIKDTTADRYAKEEDNWYITPEYDKVFLEHTVYFWDYPNYPDTSEKALFHKTMVRDGEDAVPPAESPSHEGHVFSRWTDYTNISRDTDVYPIFGSNVYAVSFRDYDGTLIGEIQYVEEGRSAVPPEDPVREGYTFDRWSQDWNNVTEDRVIVALYIDNSGDASRHTVTFYDYNGTVVSQQSVNHGEAAVEPKSPTRSGYRFTGWVPANFSKVTSDMSIVAYYEKLSENDKDGDGKDDDEDKASPSPTATPTATPSAKKYTVSVSGGSGSGSYAAGEIVAINAYFLGEGQSFDKWTTSTAGVGFANPSATSTTFTMPAANVAITATYKPGTGNVSTGNTGSNNQSGGNIVGGGGSSNSSTGGSTVEITKPGISNTDLAGATVTGATDNFIVKITEDQAATDAAVAALQARYGDISRIKYLPMDISLYDSTGRTKIADTSGISVNLTLPIPDDLVQYAGNNKMAAVVGGNLEDLGVKFTTVDGVPCINFTATHFSPYVIYVDTANLTAGGTIDSTPKTGDPIHPKWFLALGMASISLILFFKKDKMAVKSKTA